MAQTRERKGGRGWTPPKPASKAAPGAASRAEQLLKQKGFIGASAQLEEERFHAMIVRDAQIAALNHARADDPVRYAHQAIERSTYKPPSERGLRGIAHDLYSVVKPLTNKELLKTARHPNRERLGLTAGALANIAVPGPRPLRGEVAPLSRPEVRSRPWFRGDQGTWQHGDVYPDMFDPGAAFGPALYLTDNPHVAATYVEKGPLDMVGGTQRVPIRAELRKTPGGVARPRSLSDRVRAQQDYYTREGYTVSNVRKVGDHMVFDYAPPPSGQVKSYRLNPGAMLHEHHPIGERNTARLKSAWDRQREYFDATGRGPEFRGAYPGRPQQSGSNLYSWALDSIMPRGIYPAQYGMPRAGRTSEHGFAELMRMAGLDAMQYEGGARTGSERHTAMALYNIDKATPHPGFHAIGGRSANAVERYRDLVGKEAANARLQGHNIGSNIIGKYELADVYAMARQYAKDAGIRSPTAREAFKEYFIRAYQEKHNAGRAQDTPFG